MLRAAIVCRDQDLSVSLTEALSQFSQVAVLRSVNVYPSGQQLVRFLRAHAPDVIFLSVEDMAYVQEVITALETTAPGVSLVAIHRSLQPQVLLETMRVGIREFLAAPFQMTALQETLGRLKDKYKQKPAGVDSTDLLYSFLPAKAGSGTSTVAVNVAFALSRMEDMNSLLLDFDLNSGMVRFMLKLDNAYSLLDAAEHASEMDENLWPQLVTSMGQLDVLHAGTINPNYRIEPSQLRYLINFARRNYKVVCADLSGNMERYSVEVMHESKRIFLVCTPEIPSLYLACEKYKYLQQLELGDRVSLVMNRSNRRDLIGDHEVQQLVGLPVQISLPNDYLGVHKAVTAAKPVDPASVLGRQYTTLAQSMVARPSAPLPQQKKRFVEFFSLGAQRSSPYSGG